MEPGEYYIVAIVVTALFVAPFCALARIVVLSWIIAHLAWMLGLPEPIANIGGQGSVFFLGLRRNEKNPELLAWALSLPIILISVSWQARLLNPVTCWWTILIIAMLQIAALPWAVSGAGYHAVLHAWRDAVDEGFFRTPEAGR